MGPGADELEGGFHDDSCQHQCPRGRMSSPNVCCQCLCSSGALQLSPASPGGSPRSEDGSDTGSFQITASALGPRECEILCAPFKSGVSISHSPLGLQKVSPAGLQSQILGTRLPGAGPLGWGA